MRMEEGAQPHVHDLSLSLFSISSLTLVVVQADPITSMAFGEFSIIGCCGVVVFNLLSFYFYYSVQCTAITK